MDPDKLKEIEDRVAREPVPYAQVVQMLKAIGVKAYDVDVTKGTILYRGNHKVYGLQASSQKLSIAPAFSPEKIEDAYSRIERREIDYPTFLKALAEAGVERYTSEFKRMAIIFKGGGKEHRKPIPEA